MTLKATILPCVPKKQCYLEKSDSYKKWLMAVTVIFGLDIGAWG